MKEKNIKPSYATTGKAEEILELFSRMTPTKVDSKFIVDHGISTPSNAFRILDLLKWLKIVDYGGQVDQEIAKSLRLTGPDKNKVVAELIKNAYKEIFEKYDLNMTTKHDIMNFFITTYNYGNQQARHASRLFLYLCQKYDIPISEELKKTSSSKNTSQNKKVLKKKSIKQQPKKPEVSEENLEIPKEGVRIFIRAKGLSINLPKDKPATTENELNVIGKQFQSIIEAAKGFLPKEEFEEDSNKQ